MIVAEEDFYFLYESNVSDNVIFFRFFLLFFFVILFYKMNKGLFR